MRADSQRARAIARFVRAAAAVAVASAVAACGDRGARHHPAPEPSRSAAAPRVDLQARLGDLVVEREGERAFIVLGSAEQRLEPEQFIELLEAEQRARAVRPWYRLLNITSPWGALWVGIGMAGQCLFAARMLLQWIASERQRRSVIPSSFWWASLSGGVLLLAYFVWRKDVVGIAGQSVGVFVYARNLCLLRKSALLLTHAA